VPNLTLSEGWSTAVEEAMAVGVPLHLSDLRVRPECSVLLRRDHGMRVAWEHHTAFASSSPCACPLDRVRRISAVNGTPEHWAGSSDHVQGACTAQASPSS